MFFKRSSGQADAKSPAGSLPPANGATPPTDALPAAPPSPLAAMTAIGAPPSTMLPPGAPPAGAPAVQPNVQAAASARQATEAFGQIIALMMLSKQHQSLTLGQVRTAVAPLVRAGQYALLGRKASDTGLSRPLSAILWAEVSEAVDQRLMAQPQGPLALKHDEITSGSHIWIIDVLGDAKGVDRLIGQIGPKRWQGRTAKAKITGANGVTEIRTLGPF